MIQLRQTPCGAFTDTPPLRFPLERMACDCPTLSYAAVLCPRAGGVGSAELSLVLDTRNALCVERAVLDVVELWAGGCIFWWYAVWMGGFLRESSMRKKARLAAVPSSAGFFDW